MDLQSGIVGAFVGLLLGIMFTVIVYGLARDAPQLRARRMVRRVARRPTPAVGPLPWVAGGPVPGQARPPMAPRRQVRPPGESPWGEYMQGKRRRPDWNPDAGPRDW